MKILVTGGSGFIGTNVVEHFAASHEVLNIDIARPKTEAHGKMWRQIDINDYASLLAAVTGFAPDYVIHLAARTDLAGSSLADYSANVQGVENVMKVCRQLPGLKKVVVASSMLVCHVGYIPTHQRDYSATTFYGKSKVETERIVWEAALGCDWVIIRPTSIWGPWFGVPYRNFFDMVKRRMYFHIGHAACTKTYGYVGNAVYQIEQLLFADTRASEDKTFYIGDRPAINIEEWADQIARELGFKVPRIPLWAVKCAARVGDVLIAMGLPFPMSSFRLKNMTTDNVVPLDNTYSIAPKPPFDRISAIKETLKWMDCH